jgi:hypothetical protein
MRLVIRASLRRSANRIALDSQTLGCPTGGPPAVEGTGALSTELPGFERMIIDTLMPEDEFVHRHPLDHRSRVVRRYEPVPSSFLSQARMRAMVARSLRRRRSCSPGRRAPTRWLTEKGTVGF